jgi:hypothetical protein
MKKIILPGIIIGVVNLILGMSVSYLFMIFPSVAADYTNAGIMRPWSDPIMSLFFLCPFVSGIIFAWAWNKAKSLFQGTWAKRGVKFGFAMWLIASVPGMLISYSSFPLSILTIISWTIAGLAEGIAAGLILAKISK